jgi:hypothetical protein
VKDFQEALRVGAQLGFTDQICSQIRRRKLLVQPFLENLVFVDREGLSGSGWSLVGNTFDFLTIIEPILNYNPGRAARTRYQTSSRSILRTYFGHQWQEIPGQPGQGVGVKGRLTPAAPVRVRT